MWSSSRRFTSIMWLYLVDEISATVTLLSRCTSASIFAMSFSARCPIKDCSMSMICGMDVCYTFPELALTFTFSSLACRVITNVAWSLSPILLSVIVISIRHHFSSMPIALSSIILWSHPFLSLSSPSTFILSLRIPCSSSTARWYVNACRFVPVGEERFVRVGCFGIVVWILNLGSFLGVESLLLGWVALSRCELTCYELATGLFSIWNWTFSTGVTWSTWSSYVPHTSPWYEWLYFWVYSNTFWAFYQSKRSLSWQCSKRTVPNDLPKSFLHFQTVPITYYTPS